MRPVRTDQERHTCTAQRLSARNTSPERGCQGMLTMVQDHSAGLCMRTEPWWRSAGREPDASYGGRSCQHRERPAEPWKRPDPYDRWMGFALVTLLLVRELCPEGMPERCCRPLPKRVAEAL